MKKITKQNLSILMAATIAFGIAGSAVTAVSASSNVGSDSDINTGYVNVDVNTGYVNSDVNLVDPTYGNITTVATGFKYSGDVEIICDGDFVPGKEFPAVTVDEDEQYVLEFVGFEYEGEYYEPGDILPDAKEPVEISMNVQVFLKPHSTGLPYYFTWDEDTEGEMMAVADSKAIFKGEEYEGWVSTDMEALDIQFLDVQIPIYLGIDPKDIIHKVTVTDLDRAVIDGELDTEAATKEGYKIIEILYGTDIEVTEGSEITEVLNLGDEMWVSLIIDGGGKYFDKDVTVTWNGKEPDYCLPFNGDEKFLEVKFIYEIGAGEWQQIYAIELTVPEPAIGESLAGKKAVKTDTEGLAIKSVEWTPDVNTVEKAEKFTVAVEIAADKDFVIPEDICEKGTATVNGAYADIIREITGYKYEDGYDMTGAPNGSSGPILIGKPVYTYYVVYDFIPLLPFNSNFTLSADGDTHKPAYSAGTTITFKTKVDNTNGVPVDYQWFKCDAEGNSLHSEFITMADSLTVTVTADMLMNKQYYRCNAGCGGEIRSVIFSCILMPRRMGSRNPNFTLTFKDVPGTQWYHSYVTEASAIGLINGRSAEAFAPDDNMTYAEAVKLAVCMNIIYNGGDPSTDIANGKDVWYSTYVKYALDHGIIDKDISDIANEKITREEYVYIFYRALPNSAFAEINNVPGGSIPDVPSKTTIVDFKTTLDDAKTTLDGAKTTLDTAKTTLDGAKTTLTEIKTTLGSKTTLDAKTTLKTTKTTLELAKTTLEEAIAALENGKTTLDGAKTTLDTARTTLDNGIVILVKTTLDGAKTTLDNGKTTLDGAKTTLDVIKTTLDEIEKNLTENRVKTTRTFKTTLDTALAAIEDGKTTLDGAKTTLGGAKTTLEVVKTTLDGAKTTLDAKTTDSGKTTLEGAKTTLDTAKTTLELVKTTLDDAKTTLTAVKTTLGSGKTTLDGAKTTLKTTKTTLKTTKTTLENAIEALELAKTTLDTGKTTLDNGIVILVKTTLDEAKTTLKTTKTTLDEIEAVLDSKEIRDPGTFKTTLTNAIAVIDDAKTTLGGAKTTLDTGKTTLDNGIVILVKTTEEGKTTLDGAKTTLDTGKTTLDTAKTTLETAKTTLNDAKTTLEIAKTTLESGKTTLGEFKTTLEGVKTTLKTTKTTLELAKTTLEAGKTTLDTGKTTLDNAIVILVKTTEDGKTTLETGKTTLNTGKTTLDGAKTTLGTLKTTLDDIDEALDALVYSDETLDKLFTEGIRDPGTFKTTFESAIKDPVTFKTTLKTTLETAIKALDDGKTTLDGAKTTLETGKTTLDNAIVILTKTTDEIGKTTLGEGKTTDRADAVYSFYRAGILNGTDAEGTFNRTGNIKRSEVAAIVVRMMNPEQRVGAPAQLNKTTMVNK